MQVKLDKLFSELKIKDVTLRNRIVFLPHFTSLANMNSIPSIKKKYYYAERTKGGAGLIICGNYAIHRNLLLDLPNTLHLLPVLRTKH